MSPARELGNARPTLIINDQPAAQDATVYLPARPDAPAGSVEAVIKQFESKRSANTDSAYSLDGAVNIDRGDNTPVPARIVAVRCFRGTFWAVSIRLDNSKDAATGHGQAPAGSDPASGPPPKPCSEDFKPDGDKGRFFCSRDQLCQTLYDRIFPLGAGRTGLIVIAGSTGSGKSETARGLIYKHMNRAKATAERTRHLITFEDPIEKFWYKADCETNQPSDFHYTPREKGVDAPNVRSVFRDALRQAPDLVFVGEIRDLAEWKHVLDFAGTGHRVIATAHAGSLAETWGKILAAVKADTAAARSDIADRVLGIVHLRKIDESALPALWRYTAQAAKSLMADGRRSLVPMRADEASAASFGRLWFVEQIDGSGSRQDIRNLAFASDLEGL